MADRICDSCPNSAGPMVEPMPFGWDIAPVYLRIVAKKEHVDTLYRCYDCVQREGMFSPADIAEIEAKIRREYVPPAKKKKRGGR